MGWAAMGSAMAVCGYALLFPPCDSLARAMTVAGMAVLTALATVRPQRVRARLPGPSAFVPPVVFTVAASALISGARLAEVAWEAAASAVLVFVSAVCATEAAQQPPLPVRGSAAAKRQVGPADNSRAMVS